MPDFILVNLVDSKGRLFVADRPSGLRVVVSEIEVGAFEGESHDADEIERRLHIVYAIPEVSGDWIVSEASPKRFQAIKVELAVLLFFYQN